MTAMGVQPIGLDLERATREELLAELRRYRVLVENASDLILCLDAEGRITYESSAARSFLGYEPDERIGTQAFDLVHPDDLPLVIENFDATVDRTADDSPMMLRIATTDGRWVWVEVFAKNQLADPDVSAIVVALRDVTERRRQEEELARSQEALRQAERQFRSAFDHAPIGMALVALDGRWLRVNSALCAIVGYDEAELLQRTFQELTHPDDLDADLARFDELLTGARVEYEMEKRYVRSDDSLAWVQLNVSLVRGPAGEPVHVVAQVQDITERRMRHADLLVRADHDSLTGLANRACFERRLAEASARAAPGAPVAVVFIDLDGFKAINDTYGHATGDLALQEVAHRFRHALRPGDLAARVGGDELAALITGADEPALEQVVARLRGAIDQPMELAGVQLSLGASIGQVSTTVAADARDLLARADLAMYSEKRSRAAAERGSAR